MSAFDEKPPFKKRVVTVSLTQAQQEEFDALKAKLELQSDGGLIKLALLELSRKHLLFDPRPEES
jgi:DNA-binding MarR family transcriptional regulator